MREILMGYQTEYTGSVEVVPPLNAAEIAYLNDFADQRHDPACTRMFGAAGSPLRTAPVSSGAARRSSTRARSG